MLPQSEEKHKATKTPKLFILAHVVGYLILFSPCFVCVGFIAYWFFYPQWITYNHHRLWNKANIQDYELLVTAYGEPVLGDFVSLGDIGVPLNKKMLVCDEQVVKISGKPCTGEICTSDPIENIFSYVETCSWVECGSPTYDDKYHYPNHMILGFRSPINVNVYVTPTTCSPDGIDLQIFGG